MNRLTAKDTNSCAHVVADVVGCGRQANNSRRPLEFELKPSKEKSKRGLAPTRGKPWSEGRRGLRVAIEHDGGASAVSLEREPLTGPA